MLCVLCSIIFCTALNAQDSLNRSGYDKVPPPASSSSSGNYGKAPPMANPKQLNRTTASKDLNTQVQQKATNQYGPPPVSGKAASNPYGTLPKKPANAPDNQVGGNQQDGYDDVPPPPASQATNQYGKAPPMANPKQLNRTTAGKDLNTQVQQKATNQYGPPPVSGKAASNPYGTLPKKPSNAPDNQVGGNQQDGYDDIPPPPASQATNQYGKAPPMANPKQLNRTTAAKDLNIPAQQKSTSQNSQQPVSSSTAANPKSQYGPLPTPGRTQQYGPAPTVNNANKPAASAASSNATKPAATSTRTQQYGPAPTLPKQTSPASSSSSSTSGKKG